MKRKCEHCGSAAESHINGHFFCERPTCIRTVVNNALGPAKKLVERIQSLAASAEPSR